MRRLRLKLGTIVCYTVESNKTHAAMVTDVDENSMNLRVFGRYSHNDYTVSVRIDEQFSEKPKANHWSWPCYE